MRESLRNICESFIENRDKIKEAFSWENSYIYPVCAAIFTDKGQKVDIRYMEECKGIFKENTGVFSNFRGIVKLPMISMMAVDTNPEEKLRRALRIYESLKEHFFASSYLPVASMVIADMAEPQNFNDISAHTKAIYKLMKQEHPFLTSSEDSVFAALLALSELKDEEIVKETEACYQLLKGEFYSGNAVQSLSHVLALGEGTAEEKCRRVMDLYRGLKDRGYSYGKSYELATLGVLALLPVEMTSLINDIIDADDFLSNQKGYGFFGLGKRQRLMHAGMLVSSNYIGSQDNLTMKSAVLSGTVSLIAAQQAAMCAAIAAASSAAAANSSSS